MNYTTRTCVDAIIFFVAIALGWGLCRFKDFLTRPLTDEEMYGRVEVIECWICSARYKGHECPKCGTPAEMNHE